MSVLEVENLTKKFGGLVAAVDDFVRGRRGRNRRPDRPERLSGKSTVFNCIMGIYGVTEGSIRFNGDDITRRFDPPGRQQRDSRESHRNRTRSTRCRSPETSKLFTLPNSIVSLRGGATQEEIYEYAARIDIEDDLQEMPDELPPRGRSPPRDRQGAGDRA